MTNKPPRGKKPRLDWERIWSEVSFPVMCEYLAQNKKKVEKLVEDGDRKAFMKRYEELESRLAQAEQGVIRRVIEICHTPITCNDPAHDVRWCARCDAMQDRSYIIEDLIEKEFVLKAKESGK